MTLTFRGALVLVIPHHQQFGQAWHLGDLSDDPKEAFNSIICQHHSREPRRAWWYERKEKWAVHT